MLKQLAVLIRGRSHEAAEAVLDRDALVLLRQQIRDCAATIAAARKAIALAVAQNEEEEQQFGRLVARIADLEQRTIAAIEAEKHELAREAAETIALLEGERDASAKAQASAGAEIERLKRIVAASEMRLRELQRGQRVAAATDRAQRLRDAAPGSGLSTLDEAEATLRRLRTRQRSLDVAADALAAMDAQGDPSALSAKLAAAGFGPALETSADAVLQRLAARRAAAA